MTRSPARIGTPSHEFESVPTEMAPQCIRLGGVPMRSGSCGSDHDRRQARPEPGTTRSGGVGRRRSRTGTWMSSVGVVIGRDEHRLRVESRAKPLADELDDRVELELAAERQADLVDERQLGVALAGLLDRANPAERRADVLADERQQVAVGLGVLLVRPCRSARRSRRASGRRRPVAPRASRPADHPERLDLAAGHQLAVKGRVDERRLAGPEHIGRRPGGLPGAHRLPGIRVGDDRVSTEST